MQETKSLGLQGSDRDSAVEDLPISVEYLSKRAGLYTSRHAPNFFERTPSRLPF